MDDGLCPDCSIVTKCVYHRDFPEIRAECGTVAEGTAYLASRLALHGEGAQDAWRRELIDRAIADVKGFIEQSEG
ncbi:MAG: hypothetical protein ABS79_00950 [Planctomycetes bacterium SCN 63-9]|nr:MAG: hypothetical protein ABS79_00950 [Planctomycetes bacterium SCN 63-9]